MVANGSETAAEPMAALLRLLGGVTQELARVHAEGRLESLKPGTYSLIGDGLAQVAEAARAAGHVPLATRAEALAAALPARAEDLRNPRGARRLRTSYARFTAEARRILACNGRAGAPLRLVDAEPFRVLLVDDDPLEHEIVARAMGPEVKVSAATCAEDLPDRLAAGRPDMIIIDTRLSGASGTDLLARLKSLRALAGVPMLMRSNHTGDGEVVAGLMRGAVDYVPKSLPDEALRARCLDLLRSGRVRLHGAGRGARAAG